MVRKNREKKRNRVKERSVKWSEPDGILFQTIPTNHDECSQFTEFSIIDLRIMDVLVYSIFFVVIIVSSQKNHDVCPFRAQRHQTRCVEKCSNCDEHNSPWFISSLAHANIFYLKHIRIRDGNRQQKQNIPEVKWYSICESHTVREMTKRSIARATACTLYTRQKQTSTASQQTNTRTHTQFVIHAHIHTHTHAIYSDAKVFHTCG